MKRALVFAALLGSACAVGDESPKVEVEAQPTGEIIQSVGLRWGVMACESLKVTSNAIDYCEVSWDGTHTNATHIGVDDSVLRTLQQNIALPIGARVGGTAGVHTKCLTPVTVVRRVGPDTLRVIAPHRHTDWQFIELEINDSHKIIVTRDFDPTVLRVIKCIQTETNALTKKLNTPKKWLKDYVADY